MKKANRKWTNQQKMIHMGKIVTATVAVGLLTCAIRFGTEKTNKLFEETDKLGIDEAIEILENSNQLGKERALAILRQALLRYKNKAS